MGSVTLPDDDDHSLGDFLSVQTLHHQLFTVVHLRRNTEENNWVYMCALVKVCIIIEREC